MNATALLSILTWLCEELVHALLRPVWLRYCAAGHRDRLGDRQETPRSELYFRRFTRLVDAADCWPCRIEYSLGGRLCIYVPDASEGDWGYDAEDFAGDRAA